MNYFIYILYSKSADKFYVGSTSDWENRLISHNHSNRVTYTSKFRPWKIEAVFLVKGNRSTALRIERFIKLQKSRKLIEKLVDSSFIPNNKLAQLVRVPQVRD